MTGFHWLVLRHIIHETIVPEAGWQKLWPLQRDKRQFACQAILSKVSSPYTCSIVLYILTYPPPSYICLPKLG
jgi:hypothetical protein